MAVVSLTFTGSDVEIVDGIPLTLTIESSIPATIYYTMDESTPTTESKIYTSALEMPDGVNSVTVSAFGVDYDGYVGPVLTQVFQSDVSHASVSRYTGLEGFVIDRYNSGNDTPTAYDADGNEARFVDVDLEKLDIIRSDRGFNGIEPGTRIEVNIPDSDSNISEYNDQDFIPFTTPIVAELFKPHAKMIVIDNREDNELRIMLHPNGSLSNIYKEGGGKRLYDSDACYVSGGFLKRFYDTKNGIFVSYYYDNNENRYVKNIQVLPSIPNVFYSNFSNPLVFQWLQYGKKSSY